MNIFSKILAREHETDTRLGMPLSDEGARERRMNAMAIMTGGRGFRQPKKGPKLSRGGKTRAERREPYREIYRDKLEAERRFREAHAGKEGWGIARIRDCIERGDHLKP